MVDFFFADDAHQRRISRAGMGELVAIGGVHVPGDALSGLETALNHACAEKGFPSTLDPFKWSPARDHWMRDNLIEDQRTEFFLEVLKIASDAGVSANVVIEDKQHKTATGQKDHSFDALILFAERAHNRLVRLAKSGVVVIAEPSGGQGDERRLLESCHELFNSGTRYTTLDSLAISALAAPFRNIRCLQLADLVVSATTAFVAGHEVYAGPIFPAIRNLMETIRGRKGGIGLKLHPDVRYVNLYGWLLQDEHYVWGNSRIPLLSPKFPYCADPRTP